MDVSIVERNLLVVLAEIRNQPGVGGTFPKELQSFPDTIKQIAEYIEVAGEYGLAYESLVSMLEHFPFHLTGAAAIKLLEIGLLLQYKTDMTEDACFDSRKY